MEAVKTEIIRIDPGRIEMEKIDAIIRILKSEGVIAYPTDTFYGLGACCFSEKAVHRVYRLKGRELSKPLSVAIDDRSMLKDIVMEIPPVFWPLSGEFWPGPLTLVFKASGKIPGLMLGPAGSVGVRNPDHAWLLALVQHAGFPITATSANLSAKSEVSDPQRVERDFGGKIDLIVDGGRTPGLKPSTVVDISSGKLTILREGAIPSSAFEKYLD